MKTAGSGQSISSMPLNRRQFLRLTAQAATATVASATLPSRAAVSAPAIATARGRAPARNVILCIADGVSSAHYALGREWLGRPLVFDAWTCGSLATVSADAAITDSAAAGTAIATGHRTRNSSVGVDANGRPLRTVLEAARDAGLATGLVVTGSYTTATAAVFAAHASKRNSTVEIARQMAAANLTVMLGGGGKLLAESVREGGGETIEAMLRGRGYALPSTTQELLASKPGRTFGLFAPDSLRPVIDRASLGPTQPLLPVMARHALASLVAEGGDRGFFVMIEGTQTDWAAHQNDGAMLVHEMAEFDAAVAEARAFAAGRDDTLVIVCSDHGCGGFTLGNARSQVRKDEPFSPIDFVAPLRMAKASAEALWETHGIGERPSVAKIRATVAAQWGVNLTKGQAAEVLAIAKKKSRDEDFDGLGEVVSREHTFLGWTTHEHTAEDVPLFAHGPGAPSGHLHLTELATCITTALGLDPLG